MTLRWITLAAAAGLVACGEAKKEPAPESDPVREVAALSAEIDTLPFADVIAATTAHIVLPVGEDSPFLAILPGVMEDVLRKMNAESSPVRGLRRINEASRFFEDAIAVGLAEHPDFECDYPKTAEGKTQRAGYPDLIIKHLPSNTYAYLDPKVFEGSGRASSLRTFYYEPKGETGKIHFDAHHLLVGIAHDGDDGAWQFTGWDLVDLAAFEVRLKAEFQASNRDIYRDELILRSGTAAP